jgi:hypothetical protein
MRCRGDAGGKRGGGDREEKISEEREEINGEMVDFE